MIRLGKWRLGWKSEGGPAGCCQLEIHLRAALAELKRWVPTSGRGWPVFPVDEPPGYALYNYGPSHEVLHVLFDGLNDFEYLALESGQLQALIAFSWHLEPVMPSSCEHGKPLVVSLLGYASLSCPL